MTTIVIRRSGRFHLGDRLCIVRSGLWHMLHLEVGFIRNRRWMLEHL